MAVTLQISQLGKRFNSILFEGVDLRVQKPDKIGLIGDNGSGKSTFLRMLAGLESVEEGQIIWSKGAKVGYLQQEIVEGDLSGGEKKILKLCELFYGDYDVILLDEPDNHLDVDHKIWFEELVGDFAGIAIVISHDREFLHKAVNRIWYLEEKQIQDYPFTYKKFSQVYASEMQARLDLWKTQEKERKRLQDMVEMYRRRAEASNAFGGLYASVQKRYKKYVDEMVEKPPQKKDLMLNLKLGDQHKRKTAIYIQNLSKSYGDNQVLKNINLHLFCGEKLAINAPNGSGKSTLLNILVGKLPASGGEFRIGPGLKIGYYAQEHLQALDENLSPEDIMNRFDAASYLRKFLFTSEQISMPVRFLSGGQKSRLQLAKFLATNPDILVLDEPTNHLDLRTVLALENFLKDYKGTLILVSHDRELVKNVVEIAYELKDGKLVKIY